MTPTTYVPQEIIKRAETTAWTTRLGAITPEALAEREQISTAEAQQRLDEAVRLGFLEKHSVLVGYSELYAATPSGRRLARKHVVAGRYPYPEGLRSYRVTIGGARHTIACASVVAALERGYPGHRVIGEREMQRDESRQGRRLGSIDIPRWGQTRSHVPDILIWPPSRSEDSAPLPIAVEIELVSKSKDVRTAICRAWARARHIEMALYYAETIQIENLLLDTIEELKAEDMIVVNPLSEIVGSLPGFELSPQEADD
jgi:hypothetical protein